MTIDLDQLEAAAKAATPGPWRHPGRALVVSTIAKSEPIVCDCISQEFAQAPKDADYIAAVNPAVVLELVAEVRRHRKSMTLLSRALQIKNRALAIAQRKCKYAQERAAEAEKEGKE